MTFARRYNSTTVKRVDNSESERRRLCAVQQNGGRLMLYDADACNSVTNLIRKHANISFSQWREI